MKAIGSIITLCLLVSCGEEDKKATVSAKLRSTGVDSSLLSLSRGSGGFPLLDKMTANNAIDFTSFKIPIRRINLVSGLTGSAYSSASPNFYSCETSDSEDCMVELTNSDLDNLIANNGNEIKLENDTSYNGVAIEFCNSTSSETDTYDIKINGTVALGSTTYYTNAESGLSATGPSEEATISATCSGSTTPLLQPVTLGPDKDVNIVLYADPNAMAVATNYKTLVNSNCLGEESLAICSSAVTIFGTVDTVAPTVERYRLSPTTTPSSGGSFADLFVTVLYNSADEPFGAAIHEYYGNSNLERNLHSNHFPFSEVVLSDSKMTFNYFSTGAIIEGVNRKSDTSDLEISQLVDTTVSLDSSFIE